MNRWTTHKDNLFIVMKACPKAAILFVSTDNRRMMHECVSNSHKKHASGFVFRFVPLRPFA